MDQGTINVMHRLVHRWHEVYGNGPAPFERMLADWRLAQGQGAKWLSQDVEDTIISWAKPK